MKIPVCYDETCSISNEFISLSKPGKVMQAISGEPQHWQRVEIEPADYRKLPHEPKFVEDVYHHRLPNGFGNDSPVVLEQVMWANGAMETAALIALNRGVAFAPASGFHHAGWDFNGGYCTFNGLVLAAETALAENCGSVLILDFDGHYGNGTESCLSKLKDTRITHLTRTKGFSDDPEQATKAALAAIGQLPGLVLLQAGADSWEGDPYGAGYFSYEQWVERDKKIFRACKALDVPIAWNLAGGYADKQTVMLHYKTFRSAVEVWG